MRMLVFTPDEGKVLKMGVRAAKLHEYLKKNGVKTVLMPDFNFRTPSLSMAKNYIKLLAFIITKKSDDVVLFENERETRLLKFFKRLGFRLALDIRDNRALQRSAYRVDDAPEKVEIIKETLMNNIDICDYVFTVTESCRELYPKKYHGKTYVIENASDDALFRYSELPDDLMIGFVSGIAPGRGIELLLDAIGYVREKAPDVKLTIAGTPHKESVGYYKELKERFEDESTSFRDDIFYSTNAFDFFKRCFLTVIPHPDHIHYHTTLPVKLFDSMACGRPVVATRCRETEKVLKACDCGLVSDFDPKDLADKILKLLLDRELAERMGRNGRAAVEETYSWDNMAKKIIGILKKQA